MEEKIEVRIRVTADLVKKFREYLDRYFDDNDGDNYKKLVASYPVLWEDFINALCANS